MSTKEKSSGWILKKKKDREYHKGKGSQVLMAIISYEKASSVFGAVA